MRPAFILLFLVIPVLIAAIAILQPFVDPRLLMLDALVAAEVSGECCRTYYGLISTLGIMGWISTAAVSGMAAVVLYSLGANRTLVIFATSAAAFSAILGLDDAFLFHENLAQKIGIAQETVLATYCLLGLIHLGFLLRIQQFVSLPMFGAAGFFLAASLGIDVVLHSTDPAIVSLEDGAKFIGIYCWLGVHLDTMIRMLVADLRQDFSKPSARRMAFALDNVRGEAFRI